MKSIFFSSLILILFSCSQGEQGPKTSVGVGDFEGFTLTNYPQGNIQKAIKVDMTGAIILEGDVVEGKKEGAWISYQGGNKPDYPIAIINYHKGIKNGLTVEFDPVGRLKLKEYYSNGHLEGRRVKQKFGKALEEMHFSNGILHGPAYTYYESSGKLKTKVNFVNGKREGKMVYFNKKGDIIMEYIYENDKAISGGKLETPRKELVN